MVWEARIRICPALSCWDRGLPRWAALPQWSQGFLPATHQGTLFRPGSNPIVDLHPRAGTSPESQRSELDLLKWLNQRHARQRSHTGELEARIAAYEMAFQMQTAAPELIDLSGESEATRKLYGLDDPAAETFGRQCLMARRMVEWRGSLRQASSWQGQTLGSARGFGRPPAGLVS